MACCSIIIGGLTDGSPLQNIGARAPRIDVHRMSQRSTDTSLWRQTGFTTSERQSLTVAAIRGPRLKNFLWIFAWQNLDRTPATSQRKWHAQNFGRMSFGAPFEPGALRTCVPCLMVNPALKRIEGTSLTFQGHMTSSVTWPFDTTYAISYWWSSGTEPLSLSNGFRDIQWLMWRNGWHDLKRPLNKGQDHSFWYHSISHIRLPIGWQ